MKIVALSAGVALMMAGFGLTGAAQARTETVKGHLIDVMCATKHQAEGAAYGATHDKKCLLMPGCVKSGYSVLTADKRILKLDEKGSAIALDLIKQTDREKDWKVAVTGTVANDTITVQSLTLE
jgi:hypothetical protein